MKRNLLWIRTLTTASLLLTGCHDNGTTVGDPILEPSFAVEVADVAATDFTIRVDPADETGNYYVGLTTRSSYDALGGDPLAAARAFVEMASSIEELDWSVADGTYVRRGATTIRAGAIWSLRPKTTFALVVFGVDARGGVVGEPVCAFVTTTPVAPSANRLTVTATEEGIVKVEASTDEPYFLDCIEAARLEGIPDERLAEFLIGSYGPGVEACIERGGVTRDFARLLEPDTDYFAVAFGCEAGYATTEVVKVPFRTRPDEPVTVDCTFEVRVDDITATGATVAVVPSNAETTYFWNVFSTDLVAAYRDGAGLAQMMIESLQAIADALTESYGVEFTLEKAAQTVCVQGTDRFRYTDELKPDTEYCVLAVGMDRKARQTTDVAVSEPFATLSGGQEIPDEPLACTIEVSCITTEGVHVKIAPADKQMTYFSMLVDAYTFDELFGGDEHQLIEDDLAMMADEAAAMAVPLSEYLSQVLLQGDSEYDFPETFDPGEDYYAYAYGLEADGTVTTGMRKFRFTVPAEAPSAVGTGSRPLGRRTMGLAAEVLRTGLRHRFGR